ncbi:MAG TPA: exodeoxyribonuclease VII large subunit [Alphaproteobacteria bacterium]|nr:exodeoxyribonuclease VII large subunit [Alphaproteobacteria bacterium]
MSVSDLALSLKQTLEQTYGRIRVRGELSGVKVVGSGHLYGDIKDVDAVINIVCWRGNLSKLAVKPEDGMDVVITGRVSSYPKSSRYQIIIEQMELAGEGALLKMLEERRKKLAAEGLFDQNRKKKLPFLPQVIGVVTSPTGAVIRDIMHRLRDRFPRHVLLWPVTVQGDGAAEQIAAAIDGFNNMDGTGLPRPDLLIVARGGGSLEDLMAFNEEIVVRAVANCAIPVISAVGHETDTTLIDYAADLRAPTPTGAAEIAVPMRLNLIAQVQDDFERLISAAGRLVSDRKNILAAQSAKLGDPRHLLENKAQTLDYLGDKLSGALKSNVHIKRSELQDIAAKLVSPKYLIEQKKQNLTYLDGQLVRVFPRMLSDQKAKLDSLSRMLQSLSHQGVLLRGYAIIRDQQGNLIRRSENLVDGQEISIEFADQDKLGAKVQKSAKI